MNPRNIRQKIKDILYKTRCFGVWPHVSDCILCWPFGQYSPVMTYVMLVIVCWLINSLKVKKVYLHTCVCVLLQTNFSTVFLEVRRTQYNGHFTKNVFVFNVIPAAGVIGKISVSLCVHR